MNQNKSEAAQRDEQGINEGHKWRSKGIGRRDEATTKPKGSEMIRRTNKGKSLRENRSV